MKKIVVLACVVAAVTAAGIVYYGRGNLKAVADEKTPATAPAAGVVLNVEDFMKHVEQHRGPVVVEGVVSSVTAEKKMLTLIDKREFASCGIEDCAEYTLPVQWSGTLPAVKDAVRVQGQVTDSGGKFLFAANSVEEEQDKKAEAQK